MSRFSLTACLLVAARALPDEGLSTDPVCAADFGGKAKQCRRALTDGPFFLQRNRMVRHLQEPDSTTWHLVSEGHVCAETEYVAHVAEAAECTKRLFHHEERFAVITLGEGAEYICSKADSCSELREDHGAMVLEKNEDIVPPWPMFLWRQICDGDVAVSTVAANAMACQAEADALGHDIFSFRPSGECLIHRSCPTSSANPNGGEWASYRKPQLWPNPQENLVCEQADVVIDGELWQCQRAALEDNFAAFWYDSTTCFLAKACETTKEAETEGVALYRAPRFPTASPENYIMSTMHIYYPETRYRYMSQGLGILTETAMQFQDMGTNLIKLRLGRKSCLSYELAPAEVCESDDWYKSLKQLATEPQMHSIFSMPGFQWYVMWMSPKATDPKPLSDEWTDEDYLDEKAEVKEWAIHMLETYSGTGKVFLVGNWEGDWMLRDASGCEDLVHEGVYKSKADCPPTSDAVDRMVKWARARQEGIAEAREEARAHNVSVMYYIEFNQDERMVRDQAPGVINNISAVVKPDLLSYSSYSTTKRMNEDRVYEGEGGYSGFFNVMNHAESSLVPMEDAPEAVKALGWRKRVWVGEYGTYPVVFGGPEKGERPSDFVNMLHFTREVNAAMTWGSPLMLYWQLYQQTDQDEKDKTGTRPIIGQPFEYDNQKWGTTPERTVLWFAHHRFLTRARTIPREERSEWAAQYWALFEPACEYSELERWVAPKEYDGYNMPTSNETECCEMCTTDPACETSVLHTNSGDGTCYLFYTMPKPKKKKNAKGLSRQCTKTSVAYKTPPVVLDYSA